MKTLILLFLVACSGRPNYLKLEPAPELQHDTGRVVAAVNKVVGARLLLLGGKDAMKVVSSDLECGSFDHKQTITVALDCSRFGEDALAVIIVHEAGHALGLLHSSNEGSVMFERFLIGMSLDEAAQSLFDELVLQGPILLPPNEVPL